GLRIRARALKATYENEVLGWVSNATSIFNPENLTEGEIVEYKEELGSMAKAIRSIIIDADKIRNQARGESYYDEIESELAFTSNATSTLSMILDYYNIYDNLDDVIQLAIEIEDNLNTVKTIMDNLWSCLSIVSSYLDTGEIPLFDFWFEANSTLLIDILETLDAIIELEDEVLYGDASYDELEEMIEHVSSMMPGLVESFIEEFRRRTYELLKLKHQYYALTAMIPEAFLVAVESYTNGTRGLEEVHERALVLFDQIVAIPKIMRSVAKLQIYLDLARKVYSLLLRAFNALDIEATERYRVLLDRIVNSGESEKRVIENALATNPSLGRYISVSEINRKYKTATDKAVIEAIRKIISLQAEVEENYEKTASYDIKLRIIENKTAVYFNGTLLMSRDEIDNAVAVIQRVLSVVKSISIDSRCELRNDDLRRIWFEKINEIAERNNWVNRRIREFKEILRVKEDVYVARKPKMGETEAKSKAVLSEFTTVDEIISMITKAYGSFKQWLWGAIDEKIPWPGNEIVKAFLGQYLIGPVDAFVQVLNSDLARSIIAGVYYLIRAGASLIEVVAAGLAWLVLKGLEAITWLIANALDFLLSFLPIGGEFVGVVRDMLLGLGENFASVANDLVVFIHEKLAEALKSLAQVASSFLWVLEPVALIVDAIRDQLGSFLLNVYTYYVAPMVYRAYDGNMTQAMIDVLFFRDRFYNRVGGGFEFLRKLGNMAWNVLPRASKVDILSKYLDYSRIFVGIPGVYASNEDEEAFRENMDEKELDSPSVEDVAQISLLPFVGLQFLFEDVFFSCFIVNLEDNAFPVSGLELMLGGTEQEEGDWFCSAVEDG
ncbi:hypothetical protein DRJ19_05770, partial [Candidatus Woesearchaeota archaeon]